MKALTLRQPYARLVADGAKTIETRNWGTRYRGPLAIHAARLVTPEAAELCTREPFRSALAEAGYLLSSQVGAMGHELDRGYVLAVVNLVDCVCIEGKSQLPGEPERSFGDYQLGRWMWYLRDLVCLVKPVPARGRLGLWDWKLPVGVELVPG